MKKDRIRREFLKLKLDGLSYEECQKIIEKAFNVKFCIRTLKYWKSRFELGNWNLRDNSTRPYNINYKHYAEDLEEVIKLRNKTGFSRYQLKIKLEEKDIFMSESTIRNIVKESGLSRGNKMQDQRLKWIRFERDTPNSMWQLDGTEFNGKWVVPILDDCSRYCIAIQIFENNTTENMIKVLEQAIDIHGKPREILTDNGS